MSGNWKRKRILTCKLKFLWNSRFEVLQERKDMWDALAPEEPYLNVFIKLLLKNLIIINFHHKNEWNSMKNNQTLAIYSYLPWFTTHCLTVRSCLDVWTPLLQRLERDGVKWFQEFIVPATVHIMTTRKIICTLNINTVYVSYSDSWHQVRFPDKNVFAEQ